MVLLQPSKKLEKLRMRRVKMLITGEVYAVRLTEVMPYMTAYAKVKWKKLCIIARMLSPIQPLPTYLVKMTCFGTSLQRALFVLA